MSTLLGQHPPQTMSEFSVSIQLVEPTDFLILEAFMNGQNYTAGAVAYRIQNDLETNYEVKKRNINNRLPKLEGFGLLQKVPSVGRSGLYHLTDAGRVAFENRDQYGDPKVDFVDLIGREIEKRSGSDGA